MQFGNTALFKVKSATNKSIDMKCTQETPYVKHAAIQTTS